VPSSIPKLVTDEIKIYIYCMLAELSSLNMRTSDHCPGDPRGATPARATKILKILKIVLSVHRQIGIATLKPFQKHKIRIAEVDQSFFLRSAMPLPYSRALQVCRIDRKTDDIGIECRGTWPSVSLPFARRYCKAETHSKAKDPNSRSRPIASVRICCAAAVLARSPSLHKYSEKLSESRSVA
jgi:hypothetical protein